MKTQIHFKLLLWIAVISVSYSCKSDDDSGSSSSFQGEIESVNTFGGTKNERAQAVAKTQDGGYVVLGYTQSIDFDITDKQSENFDYWVLKFTEQNELQWSKTYGGSGDDKGNDIVQTQDGGYAILGYTSSNDQDVSQNAGSQDYWLVKLDPNGNLIWENSFGYMGADPGLSLIQTTDGGYFLTGVLDVSTSNGEGNTNNKNTKHAGGDYWAIKTNSLGQIQWSKYYGGNFTDTPNDAIQTNDNGFIIVGSSDSDDTDISNNKGTYDFWVIKISETGELAWEKSFGGDGIDEAQAITHTNDGNFIVIGDTRSNDQDVSNHIGAADLWVIKITPNGDLIWEKTIGGSSFDVGRSISKTENGDFIVSGSSRSADGDLSTNQGQNDAWVLKLDANASIKWQKTIGGLAIDFAYDAVELDNKSIITVGESSSTSGDISENKGFTDLLIIKAE